jgi:hydroxymethylpyrimidine/phosphomethylpyrimidine kinase
MKGGHAAGPESVDLLVTTQTTVRLAAPRIATRNTHGTGCTLAAAIAAGLAKGEVLLAAVRNAKHYITGAIAAADRLDVGRDNESRHDSGHGPIHHFHTWW